MSMTAVDAILNALLDAVEDSAAGHAFVAEEAESFTLYSHCEFQAFERHRLAAQLAARMDAAGSARASTSPDKVEADRALVNLRIAMVHGTDAVIGQLQRNDARLSHMLQAAQVDGQLSGEIGRTLRSIGSAIGDAQAELAIVARTPQTDRAASGPFTLAA